MDRLPVGLAVALTLAACAPSPQGQISVFFDQPMVPEIVGQTLLRCRIQGGPLDSPSPTIWTIAPPISQKQIACLERQPHVVIVHLAE